MRSKIIIAITVIGIIGIYFFVHYRAYNTVSNNTAQQIFVVEEGDDVVVIGRKLADADLVANRMYFYYYAWKNKLRGKFKADNYVIAPQSTIADIVYKLTTTGEALMEKEQDIKITFPEGWSVKKMAERLNANDLPGDEFEYIAQKPTEDIYNDFPFLPENTSLEGYLFPDTYFFLPDTTAEEVIVKMLENFDKKVDQERRDLIASQDRELHDMIIFASVIEGEVPSNGDRAIVAGIFQNRLDVGMALESDATLDYIKGFPEIKHSIADTKIDSPYNTYLYPGLPVGPINNPSLASIDAAIAPAETDYVYFLNNAETGETVFSRTNAEHDANKDLHGL
jgi:UPF0755 protein